MIEKLPKKYQKAVKDFYKDQDGYWLTLREGYYLDGYDAEKTIHEDTKAEILTVLRECLRAEE